MGKGIWNPKKVAYETKSSQTILDRMVQVPCSFQVIDEQKKISSLYIYKIRIKEGETLNKEIFR
jgi:hypothetical protein